MPTEKPRKTARRRAKQQRSQETVDSILTGAAQVLKEHGYAGASTERIAERAGVSIGSLYQYFSGKDDVLEALFIRESDRLAGNMGGFEADPNRSLTENLGNLIAIGAFNPNLDPPLLHELAKIPAFDQRVQDMRAGVVNAICSFLEPHKKELVVRDLRTAAQLVVLSCEGVGIGATKDMMEAGILEDLKQMAVSYLLATPPK